MIQYLNILNDHENNSEKAREVFKAIVANLLGSGSTGGVGTAALINQKVVKDTPAHAAEVVMSPSMFDLGVLSSSSLDSTLNFTLFLFDVGVDVEFHAFFYSTLNSTFLQFNVELHVGPITVDSETVTSCPRPWLRALCPNSPAHLWFNSATWGKMNKVLPWLGC